MLGAVDVADAATPVAADRGRSSLDWRTCKLNDQLHPGTECATLPVPVDWSRPNGATFGLALARRKASDPQSRVGSLVFGPGGPGDSGVERVVTGISRFSDELRRRFDIVSFDPRGIGRSNPIVCSTDLLARRPSPIITSRASFDATVAYNRRLRVDCRARTGPVFDHLSTLDTARDLDAIRAALGESKLTFHGSSYGTLLGEQYAELFPHRVRALVLESVVDHSLRTRSFLDSQAATAQDSFDQFVAWCNRTESCALHGRDVRAVFAGLLARAERGRLTDPDRPDTTVPPFRLTFFEVQRRFYGPDWAGVARRLAALDAAPDSGSMPAAQPPFVFEIFCQDWNLPVRSYREYAAHLRRIGQIAPDMKYPGALLAIGSCIGAPPAGNPQHRLKVRNTPVLLLTNARHDPADGYDWATSVARQLGSRAVLLTYDGAGHGTYNSSPCAQAAIDRYLITGIPPAPGTTCPAVEPG